MTEFFWSIPGIAIYIYVINILAQYGWNMYYQIPASFIDASITSNTTFMHVIIGALIMVALAHWILSIIIIAVVSLSFYVANRIGSKKGLLALFAILAIVIGWKFYDFGSYLAKQNTLFFVSEPGCLPEASSTKYVAPTMYGQDAIFIPIDTANKMKGGFLVKDLSNIM